MINYLKYCLLTILLVLKSVSAESSVEFTGTANISFESYLKANTLHGMYEASAFIDTTVESNSGVGIGYIHQNQGLSNQDDIVNDILYINAWHNWFPESLPGKINFTLNHYNGSDSSSQSNTTPGNTNSRPVSVSSFRDSLEIFNPVLSFINYSKTFYTDISFAQSKYTSTEISVNNLTVNQWSPAIGFSLNQQYDWIQLRAHSIDLSNDARTPGTSDTRAHSISWTHWYEKNQASKLSHTTVTLLNGERLYGVDHESRKIYNLTDMQTGSITFGATWKRNAQSDWYLYSGYEQYKDVANNEQYNSLFIYTGITNRW